MISGKDDRTELIWPGKYTASGALNQPDVPVLVPVLVERVPAAQAGDQGAQKDDRGAQASDPGAQAGDPGAQAGDQAGPRGRLFHGDNLLVMAALLGELEGQVDLIYIDPPFSTGGVFTHKVRVGAEVRAERTYRDCFGPGERSYLQVMAQRLRLMHRLLSPRGTIYVHCDWRVDAGLRLLLDEIFGAERFRSKLVWRKDAVGKGAKKIARYWPRTFDEILIYGKSDEVYYQPQLAELGPRQLREFRYRDPDGRRFKRTTLGDYSADSVAQLEQAGRIYTSASGRRYKKYYLDEYTLLQDSIVLDVPGFGVASGAGERLGYDTQKPEALLERIVLASSPPGGLVADFFCGSGTTLAVAQRLGRRWIGAELGALAVHTARKRLLRAGAGFDLLRLPALPVMAGAAEHIRRRYEATLGRDGLGPLDQVWVAPDAAPVTAAEVQRRLLPGAGTLHVLGWAWDLALTQPAVRAGLGAARLRTIPREALSPEARPADLRFRELPCVDLALVQTDAGPAVQIVSFAPESCEYIDSAQRSGAPFIDSWAVDWDFTGAFVSRWHAARPPHGPSAAPLPLISPPLPATGCVAVRVLDVFGQEIQQVLSAGVTQRL